MQARIESLPQYRELGLASLALPGLGHLLQGMPFRALLWFGGAVVLWGILLSAFASSAPAGEPLWLITAPVIAGYHSASMYAAIRARLSRSGDLTFLQSASQMLPAYLWKQAIGGALAVVGIIVIVLWTGKLSDALSIQVHRGWGWADWGWGELLSHTLLLWGITAVGGWLFWQGYHEQKIDEPRLRERTLIAHALQRGGVVTPAEASLLLHLPLREAYNYLEQLAQQGLAHREGQDGLVRYRLMQTD